MLLGKKNEKQQDETSTKPSDEGDEVQVLTAGLESGITSDAPENTFKLLLMLLFGTVIVLIISMGLNIYLVTRDPLKPDLYAADQYGNNYKLLTSSRPNLAQSSVINFAVDSATKIMSFNFKNIDPHLTDVAPNFTSRGWESFVSAMKNSKFVSNVRDYREIVRTTLDGAAFVVASGEKDGASFWKVEVPVFVTREAQRKTTESERKVAVLTIAHIKSSKFERGLAIDGFEWVAKRAE